MLDIKHIVNSLEEVRTKCSKRKNAATNLDHIVEIDQHRRELQTRFDALRHKQNEASKEIAQAKNSGANVSVVLEKMQAIAVEVKNLQHEQSEAEEKIRALLLEIPNLVHDNIPSGTSEEDNKLVRQVGTPPTFSFTPLDHVDLGEKLGLLDFERAAKLASARFCIYKGALAKLERALINFMLDVQTEENGYSEILPPFLANSETLTGTGQLPKFEDDLFKTTTGLYLIPTAEVPLTNILAGEVIEENSLPQRFAAYTPCFRSEAGSYGKDTKGLIRQHQFNKVELVSICHPDKSFEELERLTANAESILKKLELPYRVIELCAGDIGFSAAKTYDLEVWLPGQNSYREISSCSNCTDFQARRAKIRFKATEGKPQFVHTLNGSGLAVGRTLIAIMENYQQADGSILVPKILQKYMNGLEVIKSQ